ncbi:hypothetical protein MMC07_006819 [Pseudocyphellaria aurata]|nr:hypothetical protein [Pseudocyphellaria aurata]
MTNTFCAAHACQDQDIFRELEGAWQKSEAASAITVSGLQQTIDLQIAQLQSSQRRCTELKAEAEQAKADIRLVEMSLAAKQEELSVAQAAMCKCQADMREVQAGQYELLAELAQAKMELGDQEAIAASSMLLAQRLQAQLHVVRP